MAHIMMIQWHMEHSSSLILIPLIHSIDVSYACTATHSLTPVLSSPPLSLMELRTEEHTWKEYTCHNYCHSSPSHAQITDPSPLLSCSPGPYHPVQLDNGTRIRSYAIASAAVDISCGWSPIRLQWNVMAKVKLQTGWDKFREGLHIYSPSSSPCST